MNILSLDLEAQTLPRPSRLNQAQGRKFSIGKGDLEELITPPKKKF